MGAFEALKDKFGNPPAIQAPDWDLPFRIHATVSDLALGGKLTQLDINGHDRVLANFSNRLNSAVEAFSAKDRELVGLVYFFERVRYCLKGS